MDPLFQEGLVDHPCYYSPVKTAVTLTLGTPAGMCYASYSYNFELLAQLCAEHGQIKVEVDDGPVYIVPGPVPL
jgi:hypothetical protein